MFSKLQHLPLVFATLALFATTNATVVQRPSPTSYQCSVLSETISTLQLQFESTTNTYVVDLSRTHASRNKHTILIDNAHHQFDVSHHKWMSGHVADHVHSSARIHVDISTPSVCDDVSGTFKVANKTYVLEQVDGELNIHKETDIVAAAKQGLRFDSLDESPNNTTLTRNHKSPYQNKSIASDDEKFRHRHEQRSRRATPSTEGISCGVFLDADLSFFEAHKGNCSISLSEAACATLQQERVTVKMIDGLQMVAEIYQSDSMLKSKIDFHVEGTHILDTNLFVDGEIADRAVEAHEDYLKTLDTRESDDVCLNHLFSHAKFDGQSVGVANPGFSQTSGVCGYKGRNSGITTTGKFAGQWLMGRIAAHEIGHNLGANHDTQGANTGCKGGFLMAPFLDNDESTPNDISLCTVASIKHRLEELETDSNVFFKEAPYRCLKKVVPCESGAGDCCNNGLLENSGTVCRAADCNASTPFKEATCDGVHAYCPQGALYGSTEPCEKSGSFSPTTPKTALPTRPPSQAPSSFPTKEGTCQDSANFTFGSTTFPCSQLINFCDLSPELSEACPYTCDKCTSAPTSSPTLAPTLSPTFAPTAEPTTFSPTAGPTSSPTPGPTPSPTFGPTPGVMPPPRICRVDEYQKRPSHKVMEADRFLSVVKGSSTVVECAKECAEDSRCSSFDYRQDQAKCVLTSAPDVTQSYATASNTKWNNYQMTGACYGDCPATELDRFVLAASGVPMRDKSGKSGNLLKTIKNINKNKCSKQCEKNADCYAFNHRTSLDREKYPYKCELLKAPDLYDFSYHVPADITVGWRYFRMKSSCAAVKAAVPKSQSSTASVSIIVPSVLGVLLVLVVLIVGVKWLKPKMAKRSSKTHPAKTAEASTV